MYFLTGNTLADRSISPRGSCFFIDLSSPFSYHCVFLTLNSLQSDVLPRLVLLSESERDRYVGRTKKYLRTFQAFRKKESLPLVENSMGEGRF